MKQKLTVSYCRRATYQGNSASRDIRWDNELPGFGLRIHPPVGEPPRSSKVFVVKYRFKGIQRLMVLGAFGTLTPDEARRRANKALAMAKDPLTPLDPLEEKRKASRGSTLRHLLTAYIEDHAKPHKKTWKADEMRLKRNIPPRWMSRRVDAIRHADILKLHREIGERAPYEANRLVEILRKAFNLAVPWEYLPKTAINPAEGITPYHEAKRKRFLKEEELPALARAIDREQSVYVRAGLWLLLLTGLRKSELLTARWADVDETRRILRLPDSKSGEEQSASLSAAAMAILQGTPKMAKNPFILPGAVEGAHLVNLNKPWARVRETASVILWAESKDPEISGLIVALRKERLRKNKTGEPTYIECVTAAAKQGIVLPTGLTNMRLHDLRRSVGSWFTQAGVDLNVIKSALRHASISTTLVYARLGADPAREAFEQHGQEVLKIAGKLRPVEA